MIPIHAAERRRRLAVRHQLVPPHLAASPVQVASALVALHSTDPATVYLSVRARTTGPATPAAIEEALYERRELIRMLGMRRTVFVVPAGSVPVVQRSTTDRIAVDQRKLLHRLLREAGGIAVPGPWLAETETAVLGAMTAWDGSARRQS
jgi:Winged helix DNA-binding domain